LSQPILLISDLDDTIKISHTQSKLITVYRGLFRDSAFTGMADLYREILSRNQDSRFSIVSSSPPAIRRKIERFLALHKFPSAQLTLRDWLRQTSVLKYKLKNLMDQVEAWSGEVILVGDDTEHDPEVFRHLRKKFPEKVVAVYIRIVKGSNLPEGCQGFFTAFDIACSELAAGRLTSFQVMKIGQSVLETEKSSRLIPWFSVKPPLSFHPILPLSDETLLSLWRKIQDKIESIPKRKTKI